MLLFENTRKNDAPSKKSNTVKGIEMNLFSGSIIIYIYMCMISLSYLIVIVILFFFIFFCITYKYIYIYIYTAFAPRMLLPVAKISFPKLLGKVFILLFFIFNESISIRPSLISNSLTTYPNLITLLFY